MIRYSTQLRGEIPDETFCLAQEAVSNPILTLNDPQQRDMIQHKTSVAIAAPPTSSAARAVVVCAGREL